MNRYVSSRPEKTKSYTRTTFFMFWDAALTLPPRLATTTHRRQARSAVTLRYLQYKSGDPVRVLPFKSDYYTSGNTSLADICSVGSRVD